MSNSLRRSVNNIDGFKIVEKDGENKIQSPIMVLPDAVKERIHFLKKYLEDGMTFKGCFDLIMAEEDEEKLKRDFESGSYEDYLPASEEFKEWRDAETLYNLHQMEIAVAIIYGTGEDSDE